MSPFLQTIDSKNFSKSFIGYTMKKQLDASWALDLDDPLSTERNSWPHAICIQFFA